MYKSFCQSTEILKTVFHVFITTGNKVFCLQTNGTYQYDCSHTNLQKEKIISKDMAPHYHGVAKIPISKLNFNFRTDLKRRLNSKQVEKLERIFADEECDNEGVSNAIYARVAKSALLSALRERDLDETALISGPNRPIERLDLQVDCLHGLHRVEAAKETLRTLPLDEQLWTVHLYDDSISPNDEISLIEQHGNENDFEDGYMMWKILLYDRAIHRDIYTNCPKLDKDEYISAKKKWWGRLEKKGPSKATDLRQILKDARFRQAFNDLLEFPGLWEDLKLGTLHRFIGIKCQEVMQPKMISWVWV
jgi:Protein of unknown function (DUF3723)